MSATEKGLRTLMSVGFALLHPEGWVEFVMVDRKDLFGTIRKLVPDATPRQLGPLMMWDADAYTAEMPYNPVTEAVIGQGVGYYPGHDWRGPCVVTMAEGPGGIPTLSAEVRDWITLWATPAVKGQS